MTRQAQCSYCKKVVESNPNLPFFSDLGPGSPLAENLCVVCSMHIRFHDDQKHPYQNGPAKYDDFYCGCRGWD